VIVGVESNGSKFAFDAVVVATGGISYPTTGSDGDGYEFAKSVGHTVVEPKSALCAVLLKDKDLPELAGLSLKNVKLVSKLQDKTVYESEIGEMLFTHNGISGPIVLSTSSYINRCDFNNLKMYIDFKPALSVDSLLNRIDRDIADLKAKQFSTLLEGFLPKSLVKIFADRLKVSLSFKANQLDKEKRKNLANLLKNFEVKPKCLEDFNYAIVTSGGINLKEINPKYMKSKLVNGLYFVGEVLDIDALTGGFNLQIAFSTAVTCSSDFKDLRS
jgi:predicted Rossmann fold flavoprotein